VDSLVNELKHTSSDEDKIQIFHQLASASDVDSGIAYSKQALDLAKSKQDAKQIMLCLTHLGSLYSRTSNYVEAVATLNKAVGIGVTNKLFTLLTDTYLELGIIYLRQQNLDSARSVLNKGLVLAREKVGDSKLGLIYNVLGNVAK
jgi:tetratricopeptide (TPR) repeat protein